MNTNNMNTNISFIINTLYELQFQHTSAVSIKTALVYYCYVNAHCTQFICPENKGFVLSSFYRAHELLVLLQYDPEYIDTPTWLSLEMQNEIRELKHALKHELIQFTNVCDDMCSSIFTDRDDVNRCPEYIKYINAIARVQAPYSDVLP